MAMDLPSRNKISEGSRRRGGRAAAIGPEDVPRVQPARDPGLNAPSGAFGVDMAGAAGELAQAADYISAEVERQQKIHDYNSTRGAANEFNRSLLDEWNRFRTEGDPTSATFASEFEAVAQSRMEQTLGTLPDGVSSDARDQLRLDLEAKTTAWYDQAGTLQLRESQNAAVDAFTGQISGISALAYENPDILDDLLGRVDREVDAVSGILLPDQERDSARSGRRSVFEGAFNARVEGRDFAAADALLNDTRYQGFLDEDDRDRLRGAIEQEQAVVERERVKAEAAYIDRFDRTVEALVMGAPLSPTMMDQISPEAIAGNIADPEQRQVLRSQAEAARGIRRSTETVPQMSPEEMSLHLQSLIESEPQNLSSDADIAAWQMWQNQVAAVQQVASQTLTARMENPVAEAMRHNDDVAEAWAAFQGLSQAGSGATPEQASEAYQDYRGALQSVYDTQGYDPGGRILPKAFAANMASLTNNQWISDPETAAAQLGALADSMGVDWSRGFAELQAEGLNGEVASVGWLQHSPALQQRVVALSQNGGMKALEDLVPASERRTVDEALATSMEEARRGAGAENMGFFNGAYEAARLLAYDMVARGTSESEAARLATAQVLDANFRVISGGNVRGLVDPGLQIDQDALDVGAGLWLEARSGRNVAPVEDRAVIPLPGGGFTTVPTRIGDSDVSAETSLSLAQRYGFRDPLSREPLPRFDSESEAAASLAGSTVTAEILRVHPVMLSDFIADEGVTPEVLQEFARDVIAGHGSFQLSEDGTHAVLVQERNGLPVEILGEDGKPIMVPVQELVRLGLSARVQSEAERNLQAVPPEGPGVPDGPGRPEDNLIVR